MPLLAFPGGYGGMAHSDASRVSLSCCMRRAQLAELRTRHEDAGDAVLRHILASCRLSLEVDHKSERTIQTLVRQAA